MPNWTLTTENGHKDTFNVIDYRKTKYGVVLSFAIRYEYKGKTETEAFMLAPTHRHREVPKVVSAALELASGGGGAAAGYRLGSAAGMVGGLSGAALGLLLGHLATHAVDEFFPEEIDEGNYYDSGGKIAFSGLITVK
jgi:hypothetical protein